MSFESPARDMYDLRILTADDLRTMLPRWDIVPYVDALERNALLLESVEPPGNCWIVLSDARDIATETWLTRRCLKAGIAAQSAYSEVAEVVAVLKQHEQALRAMDSMTLDDVGVSSEDVVAVITLGSLQQETSSVVRLVNSTLYDALKLNASDVHLECDSNGLRVAYRLDGVLVQMTEVADPTIAEQVISRVKVMADLDIAERRIPQDGRFKVQVNEREIDFRVSVMPSSFGEDAVLRLLDRGALTEQAKGLTLESLGLDDAVVAHVRALAQKPHGMLLVTGPTGSGKTTTLYAAITEIHTGRDKIITIEDPVEYRLPRVLQIPVNEKKGLTFARGLRSILRHDPDKIMVGEIRDDETAQIAVQAALTGHLVLTTVHANNVFDVLGRFLHMGVDGYSFSSALNGIVAQRLMRVNCKQCSVATEPAAKTFASLGLAAIDTSAWNLKAGTGCEKCRSTGYRGRHAVAEVLLLDDALREMIATRAPVSALKAHAAQHGWIGLREAALKKAAAGETTLEEVLRVAG